MSSPRANHALPAKVTAENTPALLVQLERALGSAPHIQIDCAALTQFDSSAVSLLLAIRRRALATGKLLVIQNPSANLRKLAGLYGVDDLLLNSAAVGAGEHQ